MRDAPFDIAPSLGSGEEFGGVRLGRLERLYGSLFAEAVRSGEISVEERERLDHAARSLGLDASTVASLERAMLEAWESDAAETLAEPGPERKKKKVRRSSAPAPAAEPRDEESDTRPDPVAEPVPAEDPPTVKRPKRKKRLKHHPDSHEIPFGELHARYDAAVYRGALDDAWRIADVLRQRGAATPGQHEFWAANHRPGPIHPTQHLDANAWKLLTHEDEDATASEIFSVIAPAALIGRVSAMRRDGTLPRLDPVSYENPLTSKVGAVRALAWASATMGLRPPTAYVAPEVDAGFEILTVLPPSTRVGRQALSGWSSPRLAFACGRHLSWFREDHFICALVPTVAYLETAFYAAVTLGDPSIPLAPDLEERARVFSQAIVPCLDATQLERLRALAANFVARGSRVNLKRWVRGAEWTACRAGLLLCGELSIAANALANEPGAELRLAELETFWASMAAGHLRRRLGVAIG